jgi:hypothetical protein
MVKFNEIKKGDWFLADFEGSRTKGVVTNLAPAASEVCIDNGVQEFWYKADNLYPLPLTDDQLVGMGFDKQNDDGSVKYSKGVFRILTPQEHQFNEFEIWYREDRRHITHPIFLHELQNHHYSMSKIHLE